MSNFGQFTGVYFSDLNPNSYDINEMKLDLICSTKFRLKACDLRNQGNYRILLKALLRFF